MIDIELSHKMNQKTNSQWMKKILFYFLGNKASPVAKNGSVGHRVIQETFHDNSDKSHVEKVNGVAQVS